MEMIPKLKSFVKPLVLFCWAVAVGLLIFFISKHQGFSARGNPVVAEILKVKGEVQFRSEKKIVWNEASKGTGIVDGDRIATGKFSSAEVKFKDGRSIVLGTDSQVIVSTITHSDSGLTFLIHLVKGTVIANSKAKCAECRDFVLTSGGQSFVVAEGKKEGFIRDTKSKKIEKFNPTVAPN
jgi:hypothetical protein